MFQVALRFPLTCGRSQGWRVVSVSNSVAGVVFQVVSLSPDVIFPVQNWCSKGLFSLTEAWVGLMQFPFSALVFLITVTSSVYVCMCTTCVPGAYRDQKKLSDPWDWSYEWL